MTELYNHQKLALRKLTNGKVLWGGTGSGKTKVAVEYYMLKERPRDVYVITTARKRDSFDWQDEFYNAGIGPATGPSSDLVGSLESGRETAGFEAGRYPWVLTIDSWNNIAKYADVAGAFFIFDEQRLVGSGDWVRKFLRIAKHNHWIMLTATPGDTWMDYVPLFIANDFYKNRTHFKREHVVYNTFTKFPKVDRYINQGKLIRLRSEILVEMPVERHTRRRHVEVQLEYDKEVLDTVLKKRWHVYEDRPLNDVAEMFLVARKVVNSHPSRLEMVRELWKNHPKLIVFYNFNYELMALRSLTDSCISRPIVDCSVSSSPSDRESSKSLTNLSISTKDGLLVPSAKNTSTTNKSHGSGTTLRSTKDSLSQNSMTSSSESTTIGLTDASGKPLSETLAEWNGHKHQPVPDSDRWIYLVQYQAGAEAWNCTATDAMILFSQNYSWKIMEQAYGRIDRIDTLFTDLWYYGFTSNSFVDQAIARSLRAKENFNTAKYASMFKDKSSSNS